jgi:phosphotransferase system enzyme I (PtsI)
LSGIGVSSGVVSGRAVILIHRSHVLRYQIAASRVDGELRRLASSRDRSRDQLTDIRAQVAQRRPEMAALFDAQLLMLDDPMLVDRAADLVRTQRVNAEWAVQQVFEEFGAVFDEVADPYLRERKGDLEDLMGRLNLNLRPSFATPRDMFRELDESSVIIADELTPSVAAQIDWTRVRGFATDAGSRTYHTAILARSLDVPAVVGLHDASSLIQAGQLVVIDGNASEVIVDPSEEMLARVSRHTDDRPPTAVVDAGRREPARTADGVRIHLEANIEFPDDLAAARYAGAEGIGLYRSEFLLASAGTMASEDEQYEIYRGMLEGMAPEPVTVRTFDLDEDQLSSRLTQHPLTGGWLVEEERGSRQGMRGLRLSLARPDVFRVQLRALLRAARFGTLRVMFPFVSSVEQLRAARAMVAEAAADLARRGEQIPTVPIGIVIEIPAAAYTADLLAREVDFFTIGTNDLIQYCLAVDRADERVSRQYEPLHPAILRVIRMVGRAAARHRIPVSVCGEMASDPAILALLVGLGLTEFSMTPGAIPAAKQALAKLRAEDLRALARRVLRHATAEEIGRELEAVLGRLSPTDAGVDPARPVKRSMS